MAYAWTDPSENEKLNSGQISIGRILFWPSFRPWIQPGRSGKWRREGNRKEVGGGNRKEDMDRNQRKRLLSVDEDIDTGLEDVDAAMPRYFDSTDHFLWKEEAWSFFMDSIFWADFNKIFCKGALRERIHKKSIQGFYNIKICTIKLIKNWEIVEKWTKSSLTRWWHRRWGCICTHGGDRFNVSKGRKSLLIVWQLALQILSNTLHHDTDSVV